MEREIYEPDVAAYSEDVRIYVLNSDNDQLELYQIQKLLSVDSIDIMNAIRGGFDLISGIFARVWNEQHRTLDDIRLFRLSVDPINVVRIVYVDPDRIQIVDGKIEQVMITYGVIQMPNHVGLDTSVTGRLFEGGAS